MKTEAKNIILQIIRLSFLLLLLRGCAMPFSATKPNPYYPSSSNITDTEKHIWKIIDLEPYKDILLVKHVDGTAFSKIFKGSALPISSLRGKGATWIPGPSSLFYDFVEDSLRNIGYFKSIKGISQSYDNSNIEYPNSLIVEYSVDWDGGYDYTFHLRVILPGYEDVVFHVSHYHYRIFNNLDRPLFFPVFNSLVDWKNECTAKHDS